MYAKQKSNHPSSRAKDGKEVVFKQPKDFFEKARLYFEWCEANPLQKHEVIKSGSKTGDIIVVPVPRPYTIVGLCVFTGISERTFTKYENSKKFASVTEHIRDIIKQNQTEGLIANLYSSSILSQLKGQPDKKEIAENEVQPLTINVAQQKTKEEIELLKDSLSE